MTHENQHELNYENSVTQEMPAVIEDIVRLRDSALQAMEAEGFAEQADSNRDTLELTKVVSYDSGLKEAVQITTDTDTGRPSELRFLKQEEHDEPGGYFAVVKEDTTYRFNAVDGVTHLQVTSVDRTTRTGRESEAVVTERTDDAADLELLKQLTDGSRIDEYLDVLRQWKPRSEALHKEYAEALQMASRKAKSGSMVARLLGRYRG